MNAAAIASEDRRGSSITAELAIIMMSALNASVDTGDVYAACRLAGRTCAALNRTQALRLWRRFNALLQGLAPRCSPIGALAQLSLQESAVAQGPRAAGAAR